MDADEFYQIIQSDSRTGSKELSMSMETGFAYIFTKKWLHYDDCVYSELVSAPVVRSTPMTWVW